MIAQQHLSQCLVRRLLALCVLGYGGCFLVSCVPGKPIQTQAYEWRHKMYPAEPLRSDWFIPPSKKEEKAVFASEYGHCAMPTLRPYLRQLKMLTLRCTQVAHTFHRVATSARINYFTLVALGAIGGTAVLVGPILTTLKVETQNVDAGLLLTVSGAALTATAVLWLQLSGVGATSNESFKSNANMIRLIQQAETNWNGSVCHAKSLDVAMLNAAKILGQMSQQCVKDVPGVQVDPNINAAIRKQQGEVRSVIANYQALQQHMEQQREIRSSQEQLKQLVQQIHSTQQQLSKRAGVGADFLQLRDQLKSLCAQAFGEFRRLQELRQQSPSKRSTTSDTQTPAVGGWGGLCQNIPKYSNTHARTILQGELEASQKQKRELVAKIQSLHRLMNTKAKPDPLQSRMMRDLCLQASFEHRRVGALMQQMSGNKKHTGTTPPGAWAGICRLYGSSLGGLSTPAKRG